MKLFRHDCGTAIAIGIQDSDKQRIEYEFYAFWNHGATSGELHWLTSTFAYFWTNAQALRKSLIERNIMALIDPMGRAYKGKKGGLRPEATRRADAALSEIQYEMFLGNDRSPDSEVCSYRVGYLEWSTPDLDCL